MAVDNIAEEIRSLTPADQKSVRLFVEFLKHKGNVTPLGEIRLTPEEELLHAVFGESRRSSASPFAIAAAEVVEQHGELLRRLAQ